MIFLSLVQQGGSEERLQLAALQGAHQKREEVAVRSVTSHGEGDEPIKTAL